MKKTIFIFFFFIHPIFSQSSKKITFEVFGEVKLLADVNLSKNKFSELSNLRLVSSLTTMTYFGKKSSLFFNFTPSVSVLFGRGIGSSMGDKFGSNILRPTLMLSSMLGYDFDWRANPKQNLSHRIYPTTALLSTGFLSKRNNVIALGTNLIMVDFKKDTIWKQRVGSLFIGIENFEFSYANDGPIFTKWAGDGKDRFWTGSGFAGWQFDRNKYKNLTARASFDRYTGYVINAYEVANFLKMDYIPYKNYSANLYNRGNLRFGIFYDGYSAELSLNDNETFDVQYWLHKLQGFSLHRTINRQSVSFQLGYSSKYSPINLEKK